MIGDLIDTGQGTVTIHIVRNLDHPVDKVWRAITEQQHLESWFPQRVIGELTTPGAALRFEHTEFDAATFDGKVLACEPPRLLEFLWGVDVIRLEVAPHGTGCTLTLSDTIEEKGKAARDGAGWHTCLAFLEASLDGREPGLSQEQLWKSVHPDYVARFGPEASTIGPPDYTGY